jgi:hypothetical protein
LGCESVWHPLPPTLNTPCCESASSVLHRSAAAIPSYGFSTSAPLALYLTDTVQLGDDTPALLLFSEISCGCPIQFDFIKNSSAYLCPLSSL